MATRPALPLPGFKFLKHVPWLSAAVMALAVAPAAHGQVSSYTANQPLRLQGFVTYSHVTPDWGGDSSNTGVSAGTDIHFNMPGIFKPGLELRALRSTGPIVNEVSIGGGPRVIVATKFIQPYVDFLMGGGKIEFNQPAYSNYLKDRSTVYTVGGGVELLMTRTLALRVDAQHERWRLSKKVAPFAPVDVSIGVRYQFALGGRGTPR